MPKAYSTTLRPPSLDLPSLHLTLSESPLTPPPSSSILQLRLALTIQGIAVEPPKVLGTAFASLVKEEWEKFKDELGVDEVKEFVVEEEVLILPLVLLPPNPSSPPSSLHLSFTYTPCPTLSTSSHSLLHPSTSPDPLHFIPQTLLQSGLHKVFTRLGKSYPEMFSGEWKKVVLNGEKERAVLRESLEAILGWIEDEERKKTRDDLILHIDQKLHPSSTDPTPLVNATVNEDAQRVSSQRAFSSNLQQTLFSLSKAMIKPDSVTYSPKQKKTKGNAGETEEFEKLEEEKDGEEGGDEELGLDEAEVGVGFEEGMDWF